MKIINKYYQITERWVLAYFFTQYLLSHYLKLQAQVYYLNWRSIFDQE